MKRVIIIGGREIIIEALGQPIDKAFDQLHAAYFGNTPLPWEDFEAAALQFFDNNPRDWTAHDNYFTAFTIIWSSIRDTGRYDHAEHIWKRALEPALRWEGARGQRIHKGSPYYFWAMTALMRGDIDQGYLLAHQAVDEDVLTSGPRATDLPGYALVSLNDEKVEQAFRQWVIAQADFVKALVTDYRTSHVRQLTFDEVKLRFFRRPPSTEVLFLLTYTLARLMDLKKLPDHTVRNPFAGQLELNILFDIALVIEESVKKVAVGDPAIAARNPAGWTFIYVAEYLLDRAGIVMTNNQLGNINRQFGNFDPTLQAALNGSLEEPAGTRLTRLECDVALAYGVRNRGGHNTGSTPTIWNRFEEVRNALFRVLFATIDYLYP